MAATQEARAAIREALSALPADQAAILTHASLAGLAGPLRDGADLAAAADMLADEGILARGWLFEGADGEEHEISAEEIAEAEETGFLVDPSSGREAADWKDRTVRYWFKEDAR